MELRTVILELICIVVVHSKVLKVEHSVYDVINEKHEDIKNPDDNFNGVYADCFLHMSFPCVQRKTLMYLKQLNNLSEVSVIGDYVKFVKLNTSKVEEYKDTEDHFHEKNSEELTHMIDRAIDHFFDNHIIRFSALGRETSLPIPNNVEEFVGRKKRKGGGGGGGGGSGGGGHDHDGGDGFGKKKMMMMAMMCMKMKLMMMVPAMMGMMGMMSFKGMMFSMMSFMLAKMMLLMKILEKKGGGGGGGGGSGGGGGDGGWATGGGGGGAWMPAGGPDYGGGGGGGGSGGGGGGYDANGQWQSRSILDLGDKEEIIENKPIISYVAPIVRYNNRAIDEKTILFGNEKVVKVNKNGVSVKSRRKRSIIDVLQNSYLYWMNKLLGVNNNRRTSTNYPKYKIVNGVKYVFYPYRQQKVKLPKEIQSNRIKNFDESFKPIITAEDFNKGEIVEGAVESRMNRKKMNKMKETVNDTIDENPWE